MASAPPAAGIESSGLVKEYGAMRALDGVDLQVQAGEALAVFGPNGAGKTTLIRVLTSSLRPTSGSYRIAGMDARREALQVRRAVGVISHQTFLYDELTARQNLEFFSRIYGVADPRRRAEELLETVDLADRADDDVGSFSRGMQQRVSLARALVHDPRVLFLDEPFTGLDPRAARMLCSTLNGLREQGRTVLLVTHDLAQGLELTDRWILLARGRIAASGASAATTREELETRYFDRPPATRVGRTG